jgi:hypothetical protein
MVTHPINPNLLMAKPKVARYNRRLPLDPAIPYLGTSRLWLPWSRPPVRQTLAAELWNIKWNWLFSFRIILHAKKVLVLFAGCDGRIHPLATITCPPRE